MIAYRTTYCQTDRQTDIHTDIMFLFYVDVIVDQYASTQTRSYMTDNEDGTTVATANNVSHASRLFIESDRKSRQICNIDSLRMLAATYTMGGLYGRVCGRWTTLCIGCFDDRHSGLPPAVFPPPYVHVGSLRALNGDGPAAKFDAIKRLLYNVSFVSTHPG